MNILPPVDGLEPTLQDIPLLLNPLQRMQEQATGIGYDPLTKQVCHSSTAAAQTGKEKQSTEH